MNNNSHDYDRLLRAGKNLHDFAKSIGWPDDGEGAFEYVQRLSYEQGVEDQRQCSQTTDFIEDYGVGPGGLTKRDVENAVRLRREIESHPEWQPIETAPKDWTDIILYDPSYDSPFQGYYSPDDGGSDCWMEDKGMGSEQVFPTHWMPLPNPPE